MNNEFDSLTYSDNLVKVYKEETSPPKKENNVPKNSKEAFIQKLKDKADKNKSNKLVGGLDRSL